MTKEELIENGWVPKECKIDTLYFKGSYFGSYFIYFGSYFIHLRGTKAQMYTTSDDMNPIGEAETIEEIKSLQKSHERANIKLMETHVKEMKKLFEIIYGEKYE